MLRAMTDRLIFAAPPPSYTASDLEGCLCWIPWNDAVPRPGTPAATEPAESSCGTCPGGRGADTSPSFATAYPSSEAGSIGEPAAAATLLSGAAQEDPLDQADSGTATGKDLPLFLPCLWLQAARSATVLLYFHANAEDLGLVYSALLHLQRQLQVSVLAVEYPGYGLLKDVTTPSEEGICSTALVALRYLVDRVGVAYPQVMLLGRSLGSGPAVYLASRFPVGGLILVNAFTSLRAVAEAHVGWSLASLAFHEAFVNERRIHNVSCPVLFIHAAKDRTVPTEHSGRLFERCRASRKLLVTPDRMEHNSHLFADPSFLAVPAIHFFHFPGHQTDRPPRLPQQAFKEPLAMRIARLRPQQAQDKRFASWFCASSQSSPASCGVCYRRQNGESDDIAVPAGETVLGGVDADTVCGQPTPSNRRFPFASSSESARPVGDELPPSPPGDEGVRGSGPSRQDAGDASAARRA